MTARLAHSSIESFITRAWLRRGPAACLLLPLAMLYAGLAALRRALYRLGWRVATRLPVPVVVVGKIVVGGTGKTPLTIWLVRALREAGYTPGVISRGYGAAAGLATIAVAAGGDPALCGDEPLLIAEQAACPVMVGRRRVAAAQALLAAYPEVDIIVSDDGLQHYALMRDIEIVLFDGRGAGNGWPLPAGPLREPLRRRRDFTVINIGNPVKGSDGGGGDGVHGVMVAPGVSAGRLGADNPVAMELVGTDAWQLHDPARRRPLTEIPALAREGGGGIAGRIVAAAGIGNPGRFFATLKNSSAGLEFTQLPLPDHYSFAANPFAGLAADLILITEKDAVKCKAIAAIRNDLRIWVVPVTARIDGRFAEQIVEKLRERTIT